MADRIDLGDPDFEPTDAQLTGLSARAFAGVRTAHEEALRKLRARIAEQRAAVLRGLEVPLPRARE